MLLRNTTGNRLVFGRGFCPHGLAVARFVSMVTTDADNNCLRLKCA